LSLTIGSWIIIKQLDDYLAHNPLSVLGLVFIRPIIKTSWTNCRQSKYRN